MLFVEVESTFDVLSTEVLALSQMFDSLCVISGCLLLRGHIYWNFFHHKCIAHRGTSKLTNWS